MNWAYKSQSNNLAGRKLNPRISMIVALDSQGEVFLSLSQSNTNSMTMGLFFKELASALDKMRPKWRNNHIVVIDNAPYHSSQ